MQEPLESPLAKRRIRKSIDQFRLLVEGVQDYAIFMLDVNGCVVTWNAGAHRIKGYTSEEIIGKHFSIFYPEEDLKSGKADWELEVAEREGRFEDEGWRVRKDGSKFWANVIITAIRDDRGELIGFGKVTRDFTERREQEEHLRLSEERFRMLVEAATDYAIYMMDAQGYITTWNPGAERIKGYTADEIIGKHFSTFFTAQDVQSGSPQRILETAAREGRTEQEGWRVRKDGSRFWVNGIVTALYDKPGKLIGFTKITRDITERMRQHEALASEIAEKEKAQQELARSEDTLRQLSINLLRTQDEERKHIGREMHDSLGQYLSVLKMKLGTVRVREKKLSTESHNELQECAALLNECVKEVRTISYLLYPPMLEEMGLKTAISWYLDGFAQRSGIRASFEAPDDFQRLSRDVELALFRVLQEALTNVHKHSASTKVDIRIWKNSGNITLEIRDYGKGMPVSPVVETDGRKQTAVGLGLRSMAERMQQLGGTVSIDKAHPGTAIKACIPIRLVS